MPRLIRCPASFRLAQALRHSGNARDRTSIWAATGTVAHALIEEATTQGIDPLTELDTTVTVDGHDITVDAGMVEGVRVCLDEINTRSQGATLARLETRVFLDAYWPAGSPPPVSAFGTADFWAYHGALRHLDVLDYKNGAGVFVDVIDNPQLLYYAAGVLLELKSLDLPPPETVDLTIVQPNVSGREKVRTHRATTLDVLMWVDDVLIPTIAEAAQPGARIAAGAHCRFCPALHACPVKAAIAQDLARREFAHVSDAKPITYTPAEMAKVLDDYRLVEDHIKAVRELAESTITKGDRVPGWSLVPARPTRSWDVDPQTLADVLNDAGFQGPDTLLVTQPVLRSPAQIEKLLTDTQWAAVEHFVQSKSSGVKLIPDPATKTPSPQDEFA
jgi:Protein of unknown function (DUF2800)